MDNLLTEIKAFTVCVPHLELGPNPILTTHPESKIVLIGQAPRAKVHKTSIL
jgi:uracil-DNA glycosylase